MTTPSPTPPFRYTTPGEVIEVLSPDGNQGGTAAQLDTEAIVAEIGAAEDRIDSALAVRYRLPLAPVPSLVRRLARDLAVFGCELTYRGATRLQFGDYDPILMRYQAAEARLRDLVAGRAELDVTDVGAADAHGVGRARNPYAGRLFDPAGRDVDRLSRRDRDPWFGWS